MALAPGTRLGAYEILTLIGSGGMGEVYRARDARLARDVAIKVLPTDVAADRDRLARFEREAQVLASLNHPNIAAIHGVEDSTGTPALVMELVEGPTLADRIAKGPIPLDEALPIAKQTAEALEAAHESGIVHRDLKPANIKVRPDGTVKVLDFGLAKAFDPVATSVGNATMSPTLSIHATQSGLILGTAAYMSPEQTAGKAVDKRSDLWSFGVVLFEMLTARQLFDGETVSHVLASVLKDEPKWTALPANTPPSIRRLLRRCLEKDRRRRLDSAGDARLEIDDALATPPSDEGPSQQARSVRPHTRWVGVVPWALFGSALAALAGMAVAWAPWQKPALRTTVRLEAGVGAQAGLVSGAVGSSVILSPDGTLLAFTAVGSSSQQLFVRRLDQLRAVPLSGTDGAFSPFFSPDGQWIAFFAVGKLKKIAVTGGAAVTLCDVPAGRGGTWGEDGTIVFSPNSTAGSSLMRVSASGGKPERLIPLADGEATQRWPQMLPGGKAVLFMGSSHTGGQYDDADIVVQPLPQGARRVVQRGGYYGRYLPSGHVVYVHDGTLFAVPFDLERLQMTGPPAPALEGLASGQAGGAQFAFADTGTFVYVAGQSSFVDAPIFWLSKDGKIAPLRPAASNWANVRFSPDGQRLALDIRDANLTDGVWLYDWARDTSTRVTFSQASESPVWTADGRRITFSSNRDNARNSGGTNLYWQRTDGTGDVQRLTTSPNLQIANSWHPTGRFLAFTEATPQSRDLMILPMQGDEASGWKPGMPSTLLNGPYDEIQGAFSPDGRWLAYVSNETGRFEVYVRPFPGPGGKQQISSAGGVWPMWSRTEKQLLYGAPFGAANAGTPAIVSGGAGVVSGAASQLMVASYSVDGESFHAEKPKLWSDVRYSTRGGRGNTFDLHPDGERIAFAPVSTVQAGGPANSADQVVVVFNYFDELRRIAPVKR